MAKRECMKAQQRASERKSGPARASLRGADLNSRKTRALADLIRGSSVEKALLTLHVQRRKGAQPLVKLLSSALANARQRGLDMDRLHVSEVLVHKGPIQKRFMPRAHGRAYPIRKQTAHIDVTLAEF